MISALPIPDKTSYAKFWVWIPVCFAIRLIFAASRQLAPDEAFYWVLSRHLSTGYLDHPPMVAYLIKLGTMICGTNELGVRLFATLFGYGTLLILIRECQKLVPGTRAAGILCMMWLLSPLFTGLSMIMTPDTPSIFFSIGAMSCALSATRGFETEIKESSSYGNWIGFGVFTGLAMMSKYTSVLPAFSVLLAMLSSPRGRREFSRPPIWIGAMLALIVFSPVIYWNATHQWASFKFQLNHGLENSEAINTLKAAPVSFGSYPLKWLGTHLLSTLTFIGGQLGIYLPIFFVFGVGVVAVRWKEFKSLSMPMRILTISATVPLLLFLFTAFKSGYPGEANWPAFAYLPMSLLTIEQVSRQWKLSDLKWLRIGTIVGLILVLVISFPQPLSWVMKERFPNKLNEMFGWDQMARSVERLGITSIPGGLFVAERHQDAAELSFYMTGRPDVWVLPIYDAHGRRVVRKTAFEYFKNPPDYAHASHFVFYAAGHSDEFCHTYDLARQEIYSFQIKINSRSRDANMHKCIRIKPAI